MPIPVGLLPLDALARGVTVPDVSKLPDAYWGGQDQAQKQALQNLFSEGLPKNPDGTLNYGKMSEALARIGGAPQIQNILGLENLRAQQNLPPIGSLSSPPETLPQQQRPAVPSIQRTGGLPVEQPDQGGGEPKPPGQNIVQDTEVPGSARVSVDGGPEQPIPTQVASNAPTSPQFRQPVSPPTPAQPVSGPDTTRFAQSQIPAIPPQQASPTFNGNTAAQWNVIGNNALEAARRAGNAGAKDQAETYRAKAVEAFGNAKMINEGLVGAQRKQAETQVEQEKGIFDEGRKGYASGQDIQYRLGIIDESLKKLGPQWTGAGAKPRAEFARAYNTTLDFVPDVIKKEFGLTPFDPAKVASWEDFNKQSQQLGFALARTLGAREAMQIVQQATASVPNSEQSYWGAQLVSSSMRQAAQREIDYHKYLIQLRRDNKSVLDADVSFNQQRPVQSYVDKALSVLPPQAPPMEKRKVGEYYQTPRGFGIWRGNNTWEFP